MKYYLDTYALVEMYKGNSNFADYFDTDFIILDLTLAEFYGVLLRGISPEEADLWADRLNPHLVSADLFILKEASKFKYENRKKNISFFDAVGYVYALNNNLKFVTGDKEFEGMKNVEFRKGK